MLSIAGCAPHRSAFASTVGRVSGAPGQGSQKAVVEFDADAVVDFEDVKGRDDRKAVFTVVHKLRELGSRLPSPHMKSLKGEADLYELRPRQGRSAVRPIYARIEAERFVVLAIAKDKTRFDRAVEDARGRLAQYRRQSGR